MKFKIGQVLIELLLAFAVSSVALVGMAQIATKSVSNATYSKTRSEANKYAVQAIEYIRNTKNTLGWATFALITGDKCMSQLSLATSGTCGTTTITGTNFIRYATFDNVAGQKTVTVTVSWPEQAGSQKSVQTIIFKQY